MKQIRQIILTNAIALPLLAVCTLCLSYQSQTPSPVAPAILRQWKTQREKDSLTAWIYSRLQYAAAAPATRAGILDETIRTAWRGPRGNEEIQAWLDLLVNTGYTHLQAGDIVGSTDHYTQAFQWARQHAQQVDPAQVLDNILKPLGNNYTRLGDYEQALYIHQKALAIALSLDDPQDLAGTYSNLANTASNMGDPGQSLAYCRMGLNALKSRSPMQGLLLSEAADAYLQLGQESQARTTIRLSIAILEPAAQKGDEGVAYWLLTAYQQAGDIFAGDNRQAMLYFGRARALLSKLDKGLGVRRRDKAKLFQRMADLCYRTGDDRQAWYWLQQCLAVWLPASKIDSSDAPLITGVPPGSPLAENTLADCYFTAARLSARQGHTDAALHFFGLSFATENALRKELITGSSKEHNVSASRARFETAIATAWDAWKTTGNSVYRDKVLSFMESSKAQLLLDEQQQQSRLAAHTGDSLSNRIILLQRALVYYRKEAQQHDDSITRNQAKDIVWQLAQLSKNRPDDISNQSLSASSPQPPSTTESTAQSPSSPPLFQNPRYRTRSWFAGDHSLYTIECDSKGILFADRQSMPEGWQDSLRAFVHDWFGTGPRNMLNKPQSWYRAAWAIYKQIIGPHPFEKGRSYILLPDGALNGLPVEALVTSPAWLPSPAQWPYVINDVSITYAYSLATLQSRKDAHSNPRGMTGFFVSDNSRHLPRLGAINEEQQGIAAILPNGRWFIDKEADADAFRKALGESAILHISSHAFSGKDSSATPRIELSDQPFYIFELKDMQTHPALVVLSACRTGDGRLVTGDGIQSLARAFTAGGTGAVVAGWWNVNDLAAARLTQNFYKNLISAPQDTQNTDSAGPDAAECLRQSKLSWISDPAVSYQLKLPYYWAPLNYTGNPKPLPASSLTSKDSRKAYFICGIIIFLLAIAISWLLIRRRLRRLHLFL